MIPAVGIVVIRRLNERLDFPFKALYDPYEGMGLDADKQIEEICSNLNQKL